MSGKQLTKYVGVSIAGFVLALLILAGCVPRPAQKPASEGPCAGLVSVPGSRAELVEVCILVAPWGDLAAGHLVVWNSSGERLVEGDIPSDLRLLLPPDSRGASVQLRSGRGVEETEVMMRLPSDVYTLSYDASCNKPSVECPAGTRVYYYNYPDRLPVWPVGAPYEERGVIEWPIVELAKDKLPTCTWECR